MKLLVTGGAGYIGSHTAHQLVELGHEVVILDNFYSGFRWAAPAAAHLIEGNVGDAALLARIFEEHKFDAVLHFAAHIEVGESVTDPAKYYRNNTVATLTLLEAIRRAGVSKFIFSSTAAVYGEPVSPDALREDALIAPLNPYGWSKVMSEQCLRDLAAASGGDLRFVILRYFNAAGARRDLSTGQSTPRATHLIKVACEAALGLRPNVRIYGDDYPTPDGTCLRDYIHIEDLAQAHVDALTYPERGGASDVFNAGYGVASSVLSVLGAVQRVSGRNFSVERGHRRPGDPSAIFADNSKIRRVLGWTPRFNDLDLICKTAFDWEVKLQGLRR